MEFPEIRPDVPQEMRADGYPEGWCCGESQQLLSELIKELNPAAVAEIGSFKGMSAYHMAVNTQNTQIYCIDHWKGSPEHARMGIDCSKLFETFIVNLWDHRERITVIRQDSLSGLHQMYIEKIEPEFIYVDGAHDEESVYNDLDTAYKFFPKAVLCGDDWTLKGVRDGVEKFCSESGLKVKTYNDRAWRLEK